MTVRRPLRASLGLKRLSRAKSGTSVGAFTRSAREQMRDIELRFAEFIKTVQHASPDALMAALDPIYEESQRLVPVDTGDLKASGYVDARQTPKGAIAEVGYGPAGDPFYTVFTHENPVFYHEAPTQYKFLQQPLEEQMDQLLPRVQEMLRLE